MQKIISMLLLISAVGVVDAADDKHRGHGHSHAGHAEHGHTGDGHAGNGHAHDVGHVRIAAVTFAVATHGDVDPGGEAVVSIDAEDGDAPRELRAWVGIKSGRGSVKRLLEADGHGHFHGHLEVPSPLPAGSALWIEVVTAAGRQRASLALPGDGHAHAAEPHGHGHGGDAAAGSAGEPQHRH
ncbi:MAG: hypothetical protein QNJ91_10620 [Gammaproteobacteria bacterium]|nr:hypothetical protein [Gammaproteobacteria bacterium]